MTLASRSKIVRRRQAADASPASATSRSAFEGQTLWLALALIAAVIASYSSVIHNGFLEYDDQKYITENLHVRDGLTWPTVEWAFTTFTEANWHPLTWLSHALDCELFGLNPAGHHAVNVLLHAVNAVLLFLLLQQATGFRWRSLMVAALFALHPIEVESVAWAAERKNVLSMLFFLLALYAYGWYARKPSLGRYAAVFIAFALSLLAKPQAITFPFLLLLWDYWPLGRLSAVKADDARKFSVEELLLEKVPLLLLSATSGVVTMEAQRAGGAVRDLARFSLPLRLETTVISYVRYLGKALWPANLVTPYPHPLGLYPAWRVVAAVALLAVITVLALGARRQRYLAVGWLWFLGSLVPMIGLVQVGEQAMANRYAYIPFVGLFVMVVWLAAEYAEGQQIGSRWLAIPAIGCLLVLGSLTYRQVGYWHDTETFWRRALAVSQDNYIAHEELSGVLHRQGREEEAIAEVRAGLAVRPDNWAGNLILAGYEKSHGNLPAAMARYQRVADGATNVGQRASAYTAMALIDYANGEWMKARECYEQSLQLVPGQAPVMLALGVIAQENGDLAEAIRQYSGAWERQHTDVQGLLLAQALRQQGRSDEADAVYARAARSSQNLGQAQKMVDALLAGR